MWETSKTNLSDEEIYNLSMSNPTLGFIEFRKKMYGIVYEGVISATRNIPALADTEGISEYIIEMLFMNHLKDYEPERGVFLAKFMKSKIQLYLRQEMLQSLNLKEHELRISKTNWKLSQTLEKRKIKSTPINRMIYGSDNKQNMNLKTVCINELRLGADTSYEKETVPESTLIDEESNPLKMLLKKEESKETTDRLSILSDLLLRIPRKERIKLLEFFDGKDVDISQAEIDGYLEYFRDAFGVECEEEVVQEADWTCGELFGKEETLPSIESVFQGFEAKTAV